MKYAKRLALGLIFVAAVLTIAGCTSIPTAWPGLAADSEAVYATLLDGKIHALNPDNGNEMWVFPKEVARKSGLGCSGPVQPSAGPFYANPVLTEESIFVGGYDGKVYALNRMSETKQWEFTTLDEARGGFSDLFSKKKVTYVIGSPTLEGETLYISSANEKLYAVDATSGGKKWDFQAGDAIWTSPLVTKDHIYVAAMNHKLYCLDKETRKELWVFDAEGAIPSTPALAGDTIYLASLARKVFALNANTGEQDWVFEMDSWAWATPLAISDTVYVSEVNGTLFSLDAEIGDERWHFDTQGRIQAMPAYASGTLYLASEDGNLYALDAATGTQKWQFTDPERRAFMTTPVLVDGTLYVVAMNVKNPTDNKVYALDTESGAQKWVYDPTPEK